jgi:cell filamentation protein
MDPDYRYTDQQTGVLRNLADIADKDALTFAEAAVVTKRSNELKAKPIRIKDADALFAIHRHLFQDIYEWAGKRRTVEINKDGKQFFPTTHFDNAIVYINNLIADYKRIDKGDKQKLADALAVILDNVNYLHPFREGNGRTQREFIRSLALEQGWKLILNSPDDSEVYDGYMQGTINSDVEILSKLIYNQLL